MTDRRRTPDFTLPEAQPFLLEGGAHGVLLLHGFTGSAAHMRPLGERLHAAGYTVMGVNLPGHALTPEAMGRTGWLDWLDAAREACASLHARCRTVSCAGLSMGALLALILAEQGAAASVVTISAPMGLQSAPPLSMARAAALFKPTIWWRAGSREQVLDQRYDIGYPCFPTWCAADLGRLIRMARQDLSAVTCPLLTIQSDGDTLVASDSADVIQRSVRSAVRRHLPLHEVPHTCTVSPALDQIAEAAIAFLDAVPVSADESR